MLGFSRYPSRKAAIAVIRPVMEKASVPAVDLTVPLVVFILPSLFAVLLGPAVIKSLKAF